MATLVVPPVPNGTSASPSVASSTKSGAAAAQKAPVEPNVNEVVLGSLVIKPWYPSFYPEEITGRTVDRLYVCQCCFKYTKALLPYLGHVKRCCAGREAEAEAGEGRVPGEQVYKGGDYSLYEIDGEEHKLYAQNLSLFAKLFLDTKSVFYDVTTFLYYVLVAHNPSPAIAFPDMPQQSGGTGAPQQQQQQQVVGFFSKEKMSWDNNNLACILVFPPWQRQGLGQILMGASYEMSKREGRLGGPEKPLSELGRRAYMHYWSQTLARAILAAPAKKALSVVDLRDETYIVPEDIIATLQAMDVLEHRKRGAADGVINKARVRAWAAANRVDLASPVDPDGFLLVDDGEADEEDDDDEGEVEE